MKIERRITFIVGEEGFATVKQNRLKQLSGYFRSVVILYNITTGNSVNAEHTLKVMSLGSKNNDLCQLVIEGSDAELACMVLTDFIAEEFKIVSTSHQSSPEYTQGIIKHHPAFALDFDIDFHYEEIESGIELNKNALLLKLANVAGGETRELFFDALQKRELISSTGIGHQIALPHVMLQQAEKPLLSVIKLPIPIDWHSKRGDISLIIGLFLPAPPQMPIIKSFTQLSRTMLNKEFGELLISTKEAETINAILVHIMALRTVEFISK